MAGWSAKRIMSNEYVMLVMNDGLVSVSGGGKGARPQVSLPGESGRAARYKRGMVWKGDWSWTWDVVDSGMGDGKLPLKSLAVYSSLRKSAGAPSKHPLNSFQTRQTVRRMCDENEVAHHGVSVAEPVHASARQ